VELASGEHLDLDAEALHRLPVVRAGGTRVEFAACGLAPGRREPAGWCELGGLSVAAAIRPSHH